MLREDDLILGEGGWHFLEINILTLKMLKTLYTLFWTVKSNLTLTLPELIGEKMSIFQKFSAPFARNSQTFNYLFQAHFACVKF